MQTLKNFFIGLKYPIKGITFIFENPSLSRYIVVQFLINIFLFIVSFGISLFYYTKFINSLATSNSEWYWFVIYYAALILGSLILTVILILLVSIFGGILGGGLNSKLSEKTEEIIRQIPPGMDIGFFEGLSRDIGYEIKNIVLILSIYIILIPINSIPVIGTFIYVFTSFCYTLFALSLKFWDYPMERKKYSFKKKINTILNSKSLFLGFGLTSFLLFFIPVLNFIAPSFCIIGGTLLYINEIENTEK